MSKISRGKLREMLDAWLGTFLSEGKGLLSCLGSGAFSIPQAYCSLFLNWGARGDEKQGKCWEQGDTERARGTRSSYLGGTNQNSCRHWGWGV